LVEGREYIAERKRECHIDNAKPWKVDAEVAKTDVEAEEASVEDVEGQEADIGSTKGCRGDARLKRQR